MVVGRTDQMQRRSKRGAESLVQPPIIENGKRTKVHAQRKFAQGSSLSSPALTPVKDKLKNNGSLLPAEIIQAKRPKTHDFLTFLCLRGTQILPTRLDFFSVSSNDNQTDEDFNSNSCSVSKNAGKLSTKPEKSQDVANTVSRRNETTQQNGLGPKRKTPVAMPTSAVQALKKKYQDQRLSKQNHSGVLNKLAQKVKDKNMVRTRSTGQDQPKKTPTSAIKADVLKDDVIVGKTSKSEPRRATRSSGIPLSPVALAVKTPKKRIGLRSGGRLTASRELVLSKARQEKAKKAAAAKKASAQVASSLSDFSSDDDEPLASKAKTKPNKSDMIRSNAKQVAMQRLKQAKARQRKASMSPVRMQTRSKQGSENVSPERKGTKDTPSTSPNKPSVRLSRKTKEAAAVYMELLGKKWMSPDDEEEEDEDSLSLYSFPEIRKTSVEKKQVEKKTIKKKPEATKKESEVAKKPPKRESRDSSVDGKKESKKDEKPVGVQRRSISTSSTPSSRRSSLGSSPQRRSSVTSPQVQRRSLRGLAPPEPFPSPRKVKEFTESDDEPLGKKLTAASNKNTETSKQLDIKKKLKKKDKSDKIKSSLSSIAKRTRLRSEKLRLNKESKKITLSKLLEQQKKKYLGTRKSKEACIQELVQSTLDRLNKEEKEAMKRAQEMEKVHKPEVDSKVLDPVLLDKKLRNLASSSAEEKVTNKKEQDVPVQKVESKIAKPETKLKSKSPTKAIIQSTVTNLPTAITKKTVSEMPRFAAKKTASVIPHPASTSNKKLAQSSAQNNLARRPSQEKSISLPCSPVECRTPLTHSDLSKPESHCTKCGRGETSDEIKPLEKKVAICAATTIPPNKEPAVCNAVKNLSKVSSLQVQTETVKMSNTLLVTQSLPPPPLVPLVAVNQSQNMLQKQIIPQLLPTQPVLANVTEMGKFVNGLTMLKPSHQQELVLLAPPSSGPGAGKYIVCRKEELAVLQSTAASTSSALQFMVVPTSMAQEKIIVTEKSATSTTTALPVQEVRNFKFNAGKVAVQSQVVEKIQTSVTYTSQKDTKSPDEKKPIFQRRHDKSKRSDAFSPENESSVYAFQSEPEDVPSGIPFRRKTKDETITPPLPLQQPVMHSVACSTESPPTKKLQSITSSSSSSSKTTTIIPANTFVSRNVKSNSIAVQVNFDEVASTSSESPTEPPVSPTISANAVLRNSFECSTQTEEENDDDHLFYIPLQRGSPEPEQLIQGVEVKLGTEGPTGPNQRVIMRAKLVTKPPERFSAALNKTGMVRSSQHPASLLGSSTTSSSSKAPIVGTVQPTTRPLVTPKPLSQSSGSQTPNVLSAVKPTSSTTKSTPSNVKSTTLVKSVVPPLKPTVPVVKAALHKPTNTVKTTLTPPVKTPPNLKPISMVKTSTLMKTTPPTKVPPEKAPIIQPALNAAPKAQKSSSNLATTSKQKPANNTLPASTPGPSITSTKPQKVATKRASMEHASPSTSTGKPIKRPAMQRQTSTSSGSGSKVLKLPEPAPTPASFPTSDHKASLMEAPVFHPTEKDFQDPMEYIERIRPIAEQFGLCRIVPPSSFKPECKVSDDMRFTAYNHYVHKMLNRWGPNVKETTAIKKYLKSQNVAYTHPPWIGGMEIDLPRFYQTVQQLGGLMDVIQKKSWHKVADAMKIPKSAQDRVTKLDDIYCKFLLAYSTLSPEERQELFDDVEEEWTKKQQLNDSSEEDDNFDESEECITKGRNMPLNAFYRIARNTMSMWFRTPEPAAAEVESEYWRIAQEGNSHVCVHAGSIDSGGGGYGFPCNKNSPCAKHPWNLKVLSNNSGTVLRSMGSVMGVTVPTLHVGMLFSTCCWYRDPHGLPWIEYLHTGASKIWYGIPDSHSSLFRNTLNKIVPKFCRDQTIWLPSDTAMVPPSVLVSHGVSLCRTVQEPGQFILVFPRAFTSSVCTGYLVSESVYFAQPTWLDTAEEVFKELKDSCEPTMFSFERLLFSIAQDHRCNVDVLKHVQPQLQRIVDREENQREMLRAIGLKSSERLPLPDAAPRRRRPRNASDDDGDYECEVCRANLYLSLVTNSHEEGVYCLPHAIKLLTKKKHHLKYCKLLYTYEMDELQELLHQLDDKIETKSAKKSQGKNSFNR